MSWATEAKGRCRPMRREDFMGRQPVSVQSHVEVNLTFEPGQTCLPTMTVNPPTAAAPHTPRRGAYVLALRRNVLTLAAVAVVTGSALHAAALAPLAPRAAMHA